MTQAPPPYHYAVIARALDVIDTLGPSASLDSLATEMGMSAAHFQRVFSAWVGVSPKKYQQYLRLDHARSLLTQNTPLLAAANEIGLSGSSRLHDLCLTWEAMTPGEVARRGEGVAMAWGWFDSPFGPVLAMGTDKGICGMGFATEMGADATFADLQRRWPRATLREDPEAMRGWVESAFARHATHAMSLHLIGAPFQIKVWEALLRIPAGHVATYSDIAQHIGHPKAVRAVGTAVGCNPISHLIPCHRVLRKDGALGGYHWGLGLKRGMLAYEAARYDAGRDQSADARKPAVSLPAM